MTAHLAWRYAGRLTAAYAGLVLACLGLGQAYAALLVPLYRQAIDWMAPQYRMRSVRIEEIRGEPSVVLRVTTRRDIPTRAGPLPAGLPMTASTVAGHIYQHLIVMGCLLLAWPARYRYDYGGRLLAAIPFLLAVEVLDVPPVLLGSLDDLLASQGAPPPYSGAFAIHWMNFVNGGGRTALCIAASAMALALHRRVAARIGGWFDTHAATPAS